MKHGLITSVKYMFIDWRDERKYLKSAKHRIKIDKKRARERARYYGRFF